MRTLLTRAGDECDGTFATYTLPPRRVLIVDDDATTCQLVSRLLAREGYQVTTAADGSEAMIQAKRFLPDLMILDLALPSMDLGAGQFDGFGVLEWLGLSLPRTVPTIVLTCRQDEAARRMADSLGVKRFITKPFRAQEFTAAVRDVISREPMNR